MTKLRQLHFNAFLMGCGHHEAAWRLPESDPFANLDLGHWAELAQIAERSAFDSVFLADGPALLGNARYRPGGSLEPTVLLTALAAVTSHIGLIATASTTYNDPYNLARRFASLDHISGGRAGWNIVTTASKAAARNFGLDDNPTHRERYRRAAEFTDVSLALWDSWEDDAQIGDKAAGIFADPAKIHAVDYQGEYFQVAGPLNVPRSPQGRPLLVQAGSSPDGRDFAARYADAVFTAQQTLAEAQEFYADMKARARQLGRDPDEIKILPGLVPFVGSTEEEARSLEDELEELIVPEYGLAQLSKVLEIPVSDLALDERLPESVYERPPVEGAQSRYQLIVDLARRDNLTVRQLIGRLGGGRGHRTFAGTPEQVADTIQEWAQAGAADGFNVMPAVLPSGLELFTEYVVPVLRQRGLFRHDYTGTTLRDHYNIPRPASQHARPRPAKPTAA
jgi:FMN-dependent oxidoreductase (nitrilotriacetate monooxygenase family)